MYRKKVIVTLAAAALMQAACGPSKEVQEQLAQLQVVSAEKDSLVQLVVENTRVMSQISAELATVSNQRNGITVGGELNPGNSPDSILSRVKAVTKRIKASEERLRRSRRRIRSLTKVSDSLKAQIDRFETVMADLQATIENQKTTILGLNDRIQELRQQNVRLAAEKRAVQDSLLAAEREANTVYFIAGSKKELKQRGIIVEEGGSRFPLIFAKTGKTVRPARNLDPAAFTALDAREVTEIRLPDPKKSYRIASRQDISLIENADKKGKVKGVLHIKNPAAFWSVSPFLILVQD